MTKITVIILHYKNREDTKSCLESIQKSIVTSDIKWDIIVVNNDPASEDCHVIPIESGLLAMTTSKKVKIINNHKNLGFAGGINIGIKYAQEMSNPDFILVLNNDVILEKDTIYKLVSCKKEIIGPVIKFKSLNGNWVYDFGGKIDWIFGRPYHIEKSEYQNSKQQKLLEVDYISGCCMLVKSEVFEKIGLLDEKYFFYFEDTDFCTRAKKAGYKIYVSTGTFVTHKLGGSIGRWSKKAVYYNLRGNLIFILKHLGWKRIIGISYLTLLTAKIMIDGIKRHEK